MKKGLLFLLSFVMCLPLMAEQISVNEAQAVASSYLRSGATHQLLGVNPQDPQLSLAKTALSADNKVDYYVFNNGKDRGFIIVSGDDKAAPVLGYADEGSFDSNDLPDGLRYWLDCYAEQMQYLRSHPQSAYSTPRSKPNVLITPLLTCNWNQSSPYNDQCPTYGAAGTHAVTGCVATATAQVMYYHKWPKQGSGEFTYECNVNGEGNQMLSADFGSTTYDWDNMIDDYSYAYTQAQGNAVATLLSHVGIASHMSYGSTSSTATFGAMEALRLYFDYNDGMRLYSRNCVQAEQWDSLLMNELLNARPVIYAGFTPLGGGHCFVLDGVNADGYYHFNWGWGGKSNGYFLITALSPTDQGIGSYEGGYNASQEFVANVYPDKGEPLPERFFEASCFKLWPNVDHVSLGMKAPINIRYLKFNSFGYGLSTDVSVGLLLSDKSGNVVSFTSNNTVTTRFNFGSVYSWTGNKSFKYTTPESLADGDYILWLVYKVPNSEMTGYAYLNNIPNLPRYINVKVQNGTMYFYEANTESGELSITDLNAPGVVGTGSKMEVKATIFNSGKEYYDNVFITLIDENDQHKIYDPININVPTGAKVTFSSIITAPTEPGEYVLSILDKDLGSIGGGSLTVEVQESANYNLTIATPLQVTNYYMDMYDVGATAVLGNTGTNDYVGPIPFMILSGDGKWVRYSGNSDVVTVPAGGTATVNIKTAFEGTPGLIYQMCLRDVKSLDKYIQWGARVPFELNSIMPTTLLDKLVSEGIDDGEYRIADNLTIADAHEQSVFATNGRGSWIELKCGEHFEAVKAMNALKAGTVWGKFFATDGNPFITLTQLPEAGEVQPGVVENIDLSKQFTIDPAQVIDFTGYYFAENETSLVYAQDGSTGDKGAAIPISFDWLDVFDPLAQGGCYNFHGVMQLIRATSSTAALMADEELQANYVVYLTKAPSLYTAISTVNSDAVKVNVAGGCISVTGAEKVAIYNIAGALVGTGREVQVAKGIYVVVADGKALKVIVK